MDTATNAWLSAAGREPLLTASEELIYGAAVQRWLRWPGGPDAAPPGIRRAGRRSRERMIRANLRLVVGVAKRHAGRTTSLELVDLLQEGSLGLARAVAKYDPTRGYKFSTYAYWWIRQAVTRSIGEKDRTIRLPTGVGQLPWKVQQVTQQLRVELEREPTPAEVAAAAGFGVEQLAEKLAMVRRSNAGSLDARMSDGDGSALVDLVADEQGGDLLDRLDRNLALEALESAMQLLPEREREVVDLMARGVEQGQAAAAVGCSVSTLRARQAAARQQLSQLLSA